MRLFLLKILFVSALLPSIGVAQRATLKGTIVNADDFESIPGAHVFLASSKIGTVTNRDGEFELASLPAGAMQVTISMVGFEILIVPIFLKPGETRAVEFELLPQSYEMEEILVEAKRDKKWQRQLKRFTKFFIGESDNASLVEILNPEVLSFDVEKGKFEASAVEPLLVENKALGYRIRFFMSDFLEYRGAVHYQGVTFFEELKPVSNDEETAWKQRRKEAYMGSRRHLMRALVEGRLKEEQFFLYEHNNSQMPQAHELVIEDLYAYQKNSGITLSETDIVYAGADSLTRTLNFNAVIEIEYRGELESPSFLRWQSYKYDAGEVGYQQSWMIAKESKPKTDLNGRLLDPYSLVYYGYLSFEAFAEELPFEYGLSFPN